MRDLWQPEAGPSGEDISSNARSWIIRFWSLRLEMLLLRLLQLIIVIYFQNLYSNIVSWTRQRAGRDVGWRMAGACGHVEISQRPTLDVLSCLDRFDEEWMIFPLRGCWGERIGNLKNMSVKQFGWVENRNSPKRRNHFRDEPRSCCKQQLFIRLLNTNLVTELFARHRELHDYPQKHWENHSQPWR